MATLAVAISVMATGASGGSGGWSFAFYTIWNFTCLTVMFFFLVCHSFADVVFAKKLPRHLCRATWVMLQLEATNVLIVDIVVWTLLGGVSDDYVDLNVHAINLGFIILEMLQNSVVLVPGVAIFLVWVVLAYLAAVLISKDLGTLPNGNAWPYDFMEPGSKTAPLWYLGLGAAHVAMFFICYTASRLKSRCCKLGARTDGYAVLPGSVSSASISRFTTSAAAADYGSNPTFATSGKVIGWDRADRGVKGGAPDDSTPLLGAPLKPANGLGSAEPVDPTYADEVRAGNRSSTSDALYADVAVGYDTDDDDNGMPEQLYVEPSSSLAAAAGMSGPPRPKPAANEQGTYVEDAWYQEPASAAGSSNAGAGGAGSFIRPAAESGNGFDAEYNQLPLPSVANRDSTDEAGYQVPASVATRPASTDDDGYAVVP